MREFRSRYTMDIDSPIEIPQANLFMAIVRKQGRNFSSHAWILTTCVQSMRFHSKGAKQIKNKTPKCSTLQCNQAYLFKHAPPCWIKMGPTKFERWTRTAKMLSAHENF